MMSEQQQFLEQLIDPTNFGIRKACFEFFNGSNNSRIYDLRIQQINELEYYHVLLIADTMNAHMGMVNDLVDLLDELTPHNIHISYRSVKERPDGKYERIIDVYDTGIAKNGFP